MNIGGLGPLISASTTINVLNADGNAYVPPEVVKQTDERTNMALIVGVAFAGVVLLIGIVVAIKFLVKKYGSPSTSTIQP